MDLLLKMKIFVKLVESESFTKVAGHFGTSTASVSRAISELESHLSAKLLQRTTRRMGLTEVGRRYLVRCNHILACVNEAEIEISEVDHDRKQNESL
jgi:DNA-binding transcriptional LysR family regulator